MDDEALEPLLRDGLYVLPQRFPVGPFLEHLAGRPSYPGHVRAAARNIVTEGMTRSCYDMEDVVLAPGLLEAAIQLTPLAKKVLGAPPRLYSLNAFTTEANAPSRRDLNEWHRDPDDRDFLILFVYLTDVLTLSGPHEFLLRSHRGRNGYGGIATVLGPAGTMFLEVGGGLHRGLLPSVRRRTLAWARWGVSDPPPSYVWDRLKPVDRAAIGSRYPSDAETREAIRLVVR